MSKRAPIRLLLGATVSLLSVWTLPASAQNDSEAGQAFYAEKIHPLLEANCFKCHGGEPKLKGGFRVTSREGLIRGGDYGPGLDEAEPARSLFLEMVSYKDDDHQMPPKAKLPEEAIALLTEWVEMGAPYHPDLEIAGDPSESRRGMLITEEDRNFWAYQPITSPDVTSDQHPIDALIAAPLKEAGLEANPLADRRTLIRRATYDLLGLPPTPSEVDAFVSDPRSDDEAWAALIDKLLAQPQYGEKWARHWLDVVRYAESNGFERDNPKPEIWRYRDYVVNALNDDLPYDRFVIEQLAGDEIDAPTEASLTATGYHRLMQWDDEPADRKQHVYDVLADNVQTTSEAFLATTLNCARCHDHKADPISQKDYYSFMAFFSGVTHYQTPGTIVHYASEEERKRFEATREKRVADLQTKLAGLDTEIRTYLEDHQLLRKVGNRQARSLIRDARDGGATWEYTFDQPTSDWKDVGFRNKSWMKGPSGFGREGTPGGIINTAWHTESIWMRSTFGLTELPRHLVLDIHHDEDVEVYLNGHEIYRAKGFLTGYQSINLPPSALMALQTGRNVLAIHCRQTKGGQYIDAALRTGQLAAEDASLTTVIKAQGKTFPATLAKHFGRPIWKEYQDTEKAILNARKDSAGVRINGVTETDPPQLHVHRRGSAHAPGDPVEPAFLTILSGTDEPKPAVYEPRTFDGRETSGRRLALAQWIASPNNPLTARVIANRLWQHHFGRGIVASPNDFGQLGEAPTHPELLDWLAAELIREGWSLKAMHRRIMLSEAYRRSSAPNTGNLASDPTNHHLWRYDMRRLTAEEMRDSMLAVSGALNLKSGGPWVYTPLPEAVLATSSKPGAVWPITRDASEHTRRSLYIHVKRSLRHPMMVDFDQADTDTPCAARFATTVPAQALNLLNSEFVNKQAATLAGRLLQECGGDLHHQISTVIELVTQRPAQPEEIEQLEALYLELQSKEGLTADQAIERVALLALNLNEFVYLD